MSIALSGSHPLLCNELNIAASSSRVNCDSSTNDDFIEEKIWRKDKRSLFKKWKKENLVFRRALSGIELFSQDDDAFTISAKSAIVEPKLFTTGLSGKYRHVKIGFRVKFLSVQSEDDLDTLYHKEGCQSHKQPKAKTSKWYEFRTRSLFSLVRWLVMLDPTINTPGVRENLLGYECREQCCDDSGPDTWICKWDEIHPSMLDVQCLYMKNAASDKSLVQKQRKRRSSRAYSRARAFSVNEATSMHKSATNSQSNSSIHDNQLLSPESPEIHPPCYADVVNNSLGYDKRQTDDDGMVF